MLAPINYMLENKSPMDSFFGGVKSVQNMQQDNNVLRQQELVNEQQAAAQARKAQMEAELDQLDTTSIEAMRAFNAKYPDMAKGVQQAYDALDAKQKQNTLLNHSRIASLVKNGRPDAAIQMLEAQEEAHRNSNDEKGAQEAKSMADLIRMSPEAAQATLTWGLSIMSPKDVADNLKGITEATGKTRKEVDAGDAIYSYDIDPLTGEIGGAEWVVDKSATPDNVLDNETSRINTTQTNMVSEGNNIRTNQTSRENNLTTNQTSRDNNIMSNQTSRLNAQDANDIKKYGIDINAQNAANILEYRRQQDEIISKQAKLQTFNGQVYVTYPDGTAAPAKDKNGNDIYDNKVNVEAQGKVREETQRIEKLKILIPEIKTLLKDATGSRTGAAIDAAAGGLGISTQGRQTTAQLKTLSGQMVSMMPRMEGPQSDKDVEMYKEMAGNIGDPTKTRAERLAALETIEKMNSKYEALNKRLNSQSNSSQSSTSTNNDVKRSNLFN